MALSGTHSLRQNQQVIHGRLSTGGLKTGSQELTVSGVVEPNRNAVELNGTGPIIAAVIADSLDHQGMFIVKNTSASGVIAHTLTLTSGTFNGTATVATLNAPDEALVVSFDSAGDGTIVENVGAVALS